MNTSVLSRLMARGLSRRTLARWAAAVVFAAAFGSATAGGKPYSYFVTGNAQAPIAATLKAPVTSSIVLMGGGPDVDEAFRWMITRAGIAPGTGGRFVVIRATGTGGCQASCRL